MLPGPTSFAYRASEALVDMVLFNRRASTIGSGVVPSCDCFHVIFTCFMIILFCGLEVPFIPFKGGLRRFPVSRSLDGAELVMRDVQ